MQSKIISRNAHASRAFRQTMEHVCILFARPLKLGQCDFLVFFSYLVNLTRGFSPAQACDPNMDDFCPQTSVHKELNSLCITLVTFLIQIIF